MHGETASTVACDIQSSATISHLVTARHLVTAHGVIGGLVAKRGRPAARSSKLEDFAEDLGRLLGTARAKAENWIGQRQNVAKQLEQIRDTATGLLQQLTGGEKRRRPGRGRTPRAASPAANPTEQRPRRKLSARARKAISDAQKRRWAKARKGA